MSEIFYNKTKKYIQRDEAIKQQTNMMTEILLFQIWLHTQSIFKEYFQFQYYSISMHEYKQFIIGIRSEYYSLFNTKFSLIHCYSIANWNSRERKR